MGRLGEAIDRAYSKPGPRCTVADLLPKMDKEDADDLLAYLAREDVHATTIAEQVSAIGYDVSVEALRHHRKRMRHRTGGCSCVPGTNGIPERKKAARG